MQPNDELHARASRREAIRSVPPRHHSASLQNTKQAPFMNGKEKEEETSSEGEATSEIQPASPAVQVNKADPVLKKPSPKIVKAPQAPKRFKPAFIFFSAEKHKEIRAQLGDRAQSEKTSNISKLVSEAWKSLNAEEKKKWETMARNDKIRYEVEKSMYEGPWHVQKTRKQKDVNAPKRPMSAFLAFANQRRGTVKRQMPNATNGEVSRALATMWRSAPDDVRQRYINDEYEQRQEYKAVASVWKKKVDEEKREERQRREAVALRFAEGQGAPYNMDSIFQVDGLVDQSYFGHTDNGYTGYAMAPPRFNHDVPSNSFPNYGSFETQVGGYHHATVPRHGGLTASNVGDTSYAAALGLAQQPLTACLSSTPLVAYENPYRNTENFYRSVCYHPSPATASQSLLHGLASPLYGTVMDPQGRNQPSHISGNVLSLGPATISRVTSHRPHHVSYTDPRLPQYYPLGSLSQYSTNNTMGHQASLYTQRTTTGLNPYPDNGNDFFDSNSTEATMNLFQSLSPEHQQQQQHPPSSRHDGRG